MQNKIDKKYYVWIWLGLIFATFVRNVFPIYVEIGEIAKQASRLAAIKGTFSIIFMYGLVPTVTTFLLALVLYYISARRHSNYLSRNDFCYWVMIFTAVPKAIAGIVESFAILEPKVYIVTSTLLDAILLPGAYLLMFLWIFAKKYKLNPVEKSNSFSMLATIYMVFYGILVLGENLTIVSIGTDPELAKEMAEKLAQLGYSLSAITSPVQTTSSAIAICVFFAYLIAVITLSVVFKKKARAFRNVETRDDFFAKQQGNYGYDRRDDVGDTFDEFERRHVHKNDNNDDDGNGNVFDEFDI